MAKSFHQAKRHIYIDDYTLTRAITWIINNQASDGHFPEPGHVHNTFLQVCSNVSVKGLDIREYFEVTRQSFVTSLFEVCCEPTIQLIHLGRTNKGSDKSISLLII